MLSLMRLGHFNAVSKNSDGALSLYKKALKSASDSGTFWESFDASFKRLEAKNLVSHSHQSYVKKLKLPDGFLKAAPLKLKEPES